MKQRCHTWIALRAIGLLEDDQKTEGLAEILRPWAKHSYMGSWLPDMSGFKKGHGVVGNHTFKNAPYSGIGEERFILPKDKLLMSLDSNLAMHTYIKNKCGLTDEWWGMPYKAVQKDGEHLPDCLSSLFDTIADLLLLGNTELDGMVPGETGYGAYLDPRCALSKEQVSTFFFMISHYIADCFMPCHADKRKLASFDTGGIHEGWEKHWEMRVGTYFDKKNLKSTTDTSSAIVGMAKSLDAHMGIGFPSTLSWGNEKDDIWETAIYWCRAAFAMSCDIIPVDKYPYQSQEQPKFKDYFSDKDLLAEYDGIILQSAVYGVASSWKRIWRKFKK